MALSDQVPLERSSALIMQVPKVPLRGKCLSALSAQIHFSSPSALTV